MAAAETGAGHAGVERLVSHGIGVDEVENHGIIIIERPEKEVIRGAGCSAAAIRETLARNLAQITWKSQTATLVQQEMARMMKELEEL